MSLPGVPQSLVSGPFWGGGGEVEVPSSPATDPVQSSVPAPARGGCYPSQDRGPPGIIGVPPSDRIARGSPQTG